MVLRLFWVSSIFFVSWSLMAVVSPFTNKKVNTEARSYSFVVSGHFFGETHNESSVPVNTLLANLNWLNDSSHAMLITLGDVFRDVTKDPEYYERYFFSKLNLPMFNAVGNHDLTKNVYQEKYGDTYFYFFIGEDCHIVLDTELNNSDIKGDQKSMLGRVIKDAEVRGVKNVFVYGHRTIWSRSHPEMDVLFQDNTRSVSGSNNFRSDILPLFDRLAENAHVFFFAGSLGKAPASFFYHKEKDSNIHYICSAIRGLNHDAMLRVHRGENGKVTFETYSLTGNPVKDLESYDLELYLNFNPRQPFNWRLLPLYIFNMITHRYFWYGMLWTIAGLIFLVFFKRKWTRKRDKKNNNESKKSD